MLPLLLIAIGSLLLLDNLGMLQVTHIWDYWPLLLIAAGAIRLLRFSEAR